jgi:hypothetical protein
MTTEPGQTLDAEVRIPESPERLGFFAKFWNLFVDPRKTFASIGGGHEWIILWLIVGAVAIAGYLPIKDIVMASQIEQVEKGLAGNEAVTPEQRQEIVDNMAANFENPVWLLLTPVFQLVALLFASAVLLFLANIILGGNTKFLPMLNAYAWTGMLTILGTLVVVPMIMAKGSMDVSLGLGVLTSPDTGAFTKKLLTSFELFGLWQVWLSSVAVSVLANAPMGKSFTAVFAAWFVWVLVQSGLATLGMNFGM